MQRCLTRHAILMLVGGASAAVSAQGMLLVLFAIVSFMALWQERSESPSPVTDAGSVANALTLSRVAVVLLATASMPHVGSALVILAFTYNIAVDAVDGTVARRAGGASSFGAVFDREADALFVLSAYFYFYAYSIGPFGAWVLLPGLLPYLYRLGVVAVSAPVAAENRERAAAPLAGVNFVLLLAAVALPGYATPILGASFVVVLLSFGPSFWSLLRHAHSFS